MQHFHYFRFFLILQIKLRFIIVPCQITNRLPHCHFLGDDLFQGLHLLFREGSAISCMNLFHEDHMHMRMLFVIVIIHPPKHILRVKPDLLKELRQYLFDHRRIICRMVQKVLMRLIIGLQGNHHIPDQITRFTEGFGPLPAEFFSFFRCQHPERGNRCASRSLLPGCISEKAIIKECQLISHILLYGILSSGIVHIAI